VARIVTLALNPAIDSACEAEAVFPTRKVRTFGQRYDPGGGGINVARVLARLGDDVKVACLSGGATGALLDELLAREGLHAHAFAMAGHTRMSMAVFDRSTGQEYRFVPEGPEVAEGEWQAALDGVLALGGDWLVASGSLPRGVPEDVYARLAARLAGTTTRMVLDTSGPALAAAMAAGGLFMAKPSRGEFEKLVGRPLAGRAAIAEAAMAFVSAGKVAHLAVTLGHEGAILAHAGGVIDHPGLPVEVRSATGAGDSFVAGMVHALAAGQGVEAAFLWGLAAGTAAVTSPGTGLCSAGDVAAALQRLQGTDPA
jgi:6-phosphofructokinase 2